MSDIFQKIQLKKDALAKQALALESPDLLKKIEDYKYWSVHLPILKKEIEDLIGEPLQAVGDTPTSSKRSRKRGLALVDGDVELQITEILKASPEGLAGAKIAEKLQLSHWQDKQVGTVYLKVTKILNADQMRVDGERKFRKEGQLRNSRWLVAYF